jgi:uncharacterized membrane protein YkgB
MTRTGGDPNRSSGGRQPEATTSERRPWLERIGLAAIAVVMGALLTVMGIVAWAGGEWILAAMSMSGAVLTVGVALVTLVRG